MKPRNHKIDALVADVERLSERVEDLARRIQDLEGPVARWIVKEWEKEKVKGNKDETQNLRPAS